MPYLDDNELDRHRSPEFRANINQARASASSSNTSIGDQNQYTPSGSSSSSMHNSDTATTQHVEDIDDSETASTLQHHLLGFTNPQTLVGQSNLARLTRRQTNASSSLGSSVDETSDGGFFAAINAEMDADWAAEVDNNVFRMDELDELDPFSDERTEATTQETRDRLGNGQSRIPTAAYRLSVFDDSVDEDFFMRGFYYASYIGGSRMAAESLVETDRMMSDAVEYLATNIRTQGGIFLEEDFHLRVTDRDELDRARSILRRPDAPEWELRAILIYGHYLRHARYAQDGPSPARFLEDDFLHRAYRDGRIMGLERFSETVLYLARPEVRPLPQYVLDRVAYGDVTGRSPRPQYLLVRVADFDVIEPLTGRNPVPLTEAQERALQYYLERARPSNDATERVPERVHPYAQDGLPRQDISEQALPYEYRNRFTAVNDQASLPGFSERNPARNGSPLRSPERPYPARPIISSGSPTLPTRNPQRRSLSTVDQAHLPSTPEGMVGDRSPFRNTRIEQLRREESNSGGALGEGIDTFRDLIYDSPTPRIRPRHPGRRHGLGISSSGSTARAEIPQLVVRPRHRGRRRSSTPRTSGSPPSAPSSQVYTYSQNPVDNPIFNIAENTEEEGPKEADDEEEVDYSTPEVLVVVSPVLRPTLPSRPTLTRGSTVPDMPLPAVSGGSRPSLASSQSSYSSGVYYGSRDHDSYF